MQSTTRIFHNVRDPDRPVDTGDPSFVERMNPTRYLYYKEITRNLEGYEKDCQRFSEEIQRITTEMKGAREEADLVAHYQTLMNLKLHKPTIKPEELKHAIDRVRKAYNGLTDNVMTGVTIIANKYGYANENERFNDARTDLIEKLSVNPPALSASDLERIAANVTILVDFAEKHKPPPKPANPWFGKNKVTPAPPLEAADAKQMEDLYKCCDAIRVAANNLRNVNNIMNQGTDSDAMDLQLDHFLNHQSHLWKSHADLQQTLIQAKNESIERVYADDDEPKLTYNDVASLYVELMQQKSKEMAEFTSAYEAVLQLYNEYAGEDRRENQHATEFVQNSVEMYRLLQDELRTPKGLQDAKNTMQLNANWLRYVDRDFRIVFTGKDENAPISEEYLGNPLATQYIVPSQTYGTQRTDDVAKRDVAPLPGPLPLPVAPTPASGPEAGPTLEVGPTPEAGPRPEEEDSDIAEDEVLMVLREDEAIAGMFPGLHPRVEGPRPGGPPPNTGADEEDEFALLGDEEALLFENGLHRNPSLVGGRHRPRRQQQQQRRPQQQQGRRGNNDTRRNQHRGQESRTTANPAQLFKVDVGQLLNVAATVTALLRTTQPTVHQTRPETPQDIAKHWAAEKSQATFDAAIAKAASEAASLNAAAAVAAAPDGSTDAAKVALRVAAEAKLAVAQKEDHGAVAKLEKATTELDLAEARVEYARAVAAGEPVAEPPPEGAEIKPGEASDNQKRVSAADGVVLMREQARLKSLFAADWPAVSKLPLATLEPDDRDVITALKQIEEFSKKPLTPDTFNGVNGMNLEYFNAWRQAMLAGERLFGHLRPLLLRLGPERAASLSVSPKDLSTTPVATARYDGGLFTRMLMGYRNDPNKRAAGERIVDMMDATPILSKKAIAITFVDRLIFFVLATLLRSAVLTLVAWLVGNGAVKSLRWAMVAYGAVYTALMLLLLAAVTLSDSTLRISVNYINPHANLTNLFTHLFIAWMVLFVGITVLFVQGAGADAASETRRVLPSTADREDIVSNLTAITFFMWIITSAQILFT